MGFISDSIKRFQEMTERGEPGTQEAKALFNMFGQTLNDIVQGTIAGTAQSQQRAAEERAGRERFQMMAAMLGLRTGGSGNLTWESREKILDFIANTIELRSKANFILSDRIGVTRYGRPGDNSNRWYEFTVSGRLMAGDPQAGHDAADAFRRFLDSAKIGYKERVSRNIVELVTREQGSTHVFRVNLSDVPYDWHKVAEIDLEHALSQLLNAMAPPGSRAVPEPEPVQRVEPRRPDWSDEDAIRESLSTRPDRPTGFGYKSTWYAAKAGSAEEVVEKMELQVVGRANWDTGMAAAYRGDYIFVSPPVRGHVFAVGLCAGDTSTIDVLGRRFPELMFFGTHRVSDWHSWARCQDGRLVRYYTYYADQIISLGAFTKEEIALGLDRCPQSLDDLQRDLQRDYPRLTNEQDVLNLAKAWGADPLFDGVEVAPGCGYLCRGVSEYHRFTFDRDWLDDDRWGEAEDDGNGEVEDDYEIDKSLSQEPDLPTAFDIRTPWYAARAGFALEVVAKMELEVYSPANWRSGLQGCLYNDFIFVTPSVRGRVYAIGRGCRFDLQTFTTMGARFKELMFFSRNSWARSQDGQLTRHYSYSGSAGVPESVGEFTEEEVELGFDQFARSVDASGGRRPRFPKEQYVLPLAKAWGADPTHTDSDVEPGCGYLCRPVRLKSRHNNDDSLTLYPPMSDPDPAEIERMQSFFLPDMADPDGYEVRWPPAPPPGWAETHPTYDDSYIEANAHITWDNGSLVVDIPRGQRVFDTVYQACATLGWYATASDDVRLVFSDESFNALRQREWFYPEAYVWIDSAEDLRAFHGERDSWKCGFVRAEVDVYFDESGQFLMVPSFYGEYGQPERPSWDGEAGPAELGEKVLKCLTASCNRTRPEPGEAYVGTKLGMHSFIKTRQRVHVGTDPALGPLSVAFWRRTESLEYVPPSKDDPAEWTVRLPLDAGPDAVGQAVLQVLTIAGVVTRHNAV